MAALEERIKGFAKARGVQVVGVAGPERLDGPPSLDPAYTMKGARSIVAMALPMHVPAIYSFLSKESPSPHNVDQAHGNQRMHRVSRDVADFIRSLGHRALVVPPNNTYRRSLDAFATHPSFSHRFGAIASGIAGQGWSGNVMTREYGAAVYLGSVVTDALLESDPAIPPRHFVDEYCSKCKLCAKTCVAGMFSPDEEEYVLLGGELHPRGRRRSIDLCNASCFGLHSLSPDKLWTTWGRHWIPGWVGRQPRGGALKLRATLMVQAALTGDAAARFELIRRTGKYMFSEELMDALPAVEELPGGQQERNRILTEHAAKVGVTGMKDPNVLTCGQCSLVCGPTLEETDARFQALLDGGLAVPGPDGVMTRASSFEEAVAVRRQYPHRAGVLEMLKDSLASFVLWHRHYFGFEPGSFARGAEYHRELERAVRERTYSQTEKTA